MAVVSIKNKLRRGNLLVGNDPFIPSDYESIATVTISASGGSYSIGFTNIPQTYTHLQVRGLLRSNRGSSAVEGLNMRVDDNSGANYAYHRIIGDGSSATASGEANQTGMPLGGIPASGAAASIYGAIVIDILDYTNTNKYKTVRTLIGEDRNGAGSVRFSSGFYFNNTTAISQFYLYGSSSENLSQFSTLALYGIKG